MANYLYDEGGNNAVCVNEAGDTEVLDALLAEDLLASLEPHHMLGAVEELRYNTAQCTEHSPPSVDGLDLTVTGEGHGISREASRVPPGAESMRDENDEVIVSWRSAGRRKGTGKGVGCWVRVPDKRFQFQGMVIIMELHKSDNCARSDIE